jgi:hypothetical protein
MSALGQKQTQPSGPMNARFTSESDIRGYGSNVCFVPIADIARLFLLLILPNDPLQRQTKREG